MHKPFNDLSKPPRKVLRFFNYENILASLTSQFSSLSSEYLTLSDSVTLPDHLSMPKASQLSTNTQKESSHLSTRLVYVDQLKLIEALKERITALQHAIIHLKSNTNITSEQPPTHIGASPQQSYKKLALDLFEQGEIEKAIEFVKEALKTDKNIFNTEEYIPVKCADVNIIFEVSALLPRSVFVPRIISLGKTEKAQWAKYYKEQAAKLSDGNKIFHVFRLIEEALKNDPSIMDEEEGFFLPAPLVIYAIEIAKVDYETSDSFGIHQFEYNSSIFYKLLNTAEDFAIIETKDSIAALLVFDYPLDISDELKSQLTTLISLQLPKTRLTIICETLSYQLTSQWLKKDKKERCTNIFYNENRVMDVLWEFTDEMIYLINNKKLTLNNMQVYYDIAMMRAAESGTYHRIEYLIDCKVPVNTVDYTGWTPLMTAAKYNHPEITRLLLSKNAVLTEAQRSLLSEEELQLIEQNQKALENKGKIIKDDSKELDAMQAKSLDSEQHIMDQSNKGFGMNN